MPNTLGKALCSALFASALLLPQTAFAHFGMVIPERDIVEEKKDAGVNVLFAFAHPMDMQGMNLERPKAFVLDGDGRRTDLELEQTTFLDHKAWSAVFKAARPSLSRIVMEPLPYFEEAEDCYIVHHTKVHVAAFGDEEGWDRPAGLKTEIVPLTRPVGHWAGNVFQGQVLLDGKPVAGCEVEVEYFNEKKALTPPNAHLVAQVVKTDENGVFTFACPIPGWWGFAALNTADEKMEHKGEMKNVELGAVLWTRFEALPGK